MPLFLQQGSTAEPSLLPGWVAVQDPSSGQTYYANQSTGEASWEPPLAPVPQPAPTPAPVVNSYEAQPSSSSSQQPQTTQPASSFSGTSANGSSGRSSTSQKVASKYGDGFVTSASNPQLAEQYGNVGTR